VSFSPHTLHHTAPQFTAHLYTQVPSVFFSRHTHCTTLQNNSPHVTTHSYLQVCFPSSWSVFVTTHTAPHCTTLHHTAPHCTTLHHTAPHGTTLHHTQVPTSVFFLIVECLSSSLDYLCAGDTIFLNIYIYICLYI